MKTSENSAKLKITFNGKRLAHGTCSQGPEEWDDKAHQCLCTPVPFHITERKVRTVTKITQTHAANRVTCTSELHTVKLTMKKVRQFQGNRNLITVTAKARLWTHY